MEVKEAPDFPEKVYIPRDPEYPQFPDIWWERESNGSNIEYTRTDAFIKKSEKFIKENIDHYIGHYLNDDDTYLDDSFFPDFKTYMKGK